MRSRPLRFFIITFSVILILAIVLAALGWVLVRRSFPQTEGALQLPSLDSPVHVYRDSYGIPHIYAQTEHDLFLAQGFVHAQDRFWQMEFWRRIGSGRLSEILGPSSLEEDRFLRTLGWHRIAEQELENMPAEDRALLDAYADGVNAYLVINQGRLGLEFTLLGLTGVDYTPEPWTPLNTLTWAKVMAWDLGGNMTSELTRAHISARLGSPALGTLMPPYPEDFPVIVGHPLSNETMLAVPDPVFDLHPLGAGDDVGSNNWVIAGSRTASGSPILANDPHLGIQMPSIWYEIGLHCEPVGPACPYDVVGASFASAPGVIIGHNTHIAWGVTNLGPDVQDLFIEAVNPENPNQYQYLGQWLDMEIHREEILIAGEEEPDVIFVRSTRHGPIINDVVGGVEEDWAFGWQPLALSWTALEPSTLFKSVFLIDKAQNWEEFRAALEYWDVPSQNFVYADIDGNIGYQAPGRIPIRAAGDGSVPVPGWTAQYEWVATIPFNELPMAFNPSEGYIVTANNAVVGADYPYFISMDWSAGYRAKRLVELIEPATSVKIQDLQSFQGDTKPLYATLVLPYLLELQPDDARLAQAVEILQRWDGQATRDSSGAALFEALRIQLVDRVFRDELGEQLLKRTRSDASVALPNILSNPDSPWFDDLTTPEVETREDILLLALEAAVDECSDAMGNDVSNWQWGKMHRAEFENQSLGRSGIGLIEAIFNRGPVVVDGTIATVNNTGYDMGDPYRVETVPSYRQIIDLGDLRASISMHTTGQSGHAFHTHYDDMIDPWRNIEYHPMLWTRAQVEAYSEAHLILTPGG
jgi:penicillin amidase